MLFSPKSLWGDEFFSIDLASRSWAEVLKGSVQDVHPPLYFFLLHFSMAIFGNAEWAFRLVSAVASIGTMVGIYLLAREWAGKRAAFFALILAAASPYWLQSSNEIRGYSLLACESIFALYFFSRMKWGSYAAVMVAALYTEHYAWFVWGATLIAGFLRFRADRSALVRFFKSQALVAAVGALSFAVLVYQAIFREHVFHAYRMKEYFSVGILLKKAAGIAWHFTNGYSFSMLTLDRLAAYSKSSPYFFISASACIAALTLFVMQLKTILSQNKPSFTLVFLVLCFPVLLLGAFYPIRLDARYLSFAAPLFFVIVGSGLAAVSAKTVRVGLLALLLSTALVGSALSIASPSDPIHKEDYRGLVAYVFREAGEADLICGLSQQVRYYKEKARPSAKARITAEIPDLDAAALAGVKRIWLLDIVNMHDDVTERICSEKRALVEPLGFRAKGTCVRYGGPESLLAYTVFDRK
jgi:uncharacterized membrane protein